MLVIFSDTQKSAGLVRRQAQVSPVATECPQLAPEAQRPRLQGPAETRCPGLHVQSLGIRGMRQA